MPYLFYLIYRSEYVDTPCEECGQLSRTVTTFQPGNGFNESQVVREARMSNLIWEDALASEELAPDYKATNVSVYDKKGHLVSISKVILLDNSNFQSLFLVFL